MKAVLKFDPVLIELGMHPSCDLALDAVNLALDAVVLTLDAVVLALDVVQKCIAQDL